MDDIDRTIHAWRKSPTLHEVKQPASAQDFARAEVALGRPLPLDLKLIYGFSNGMGLMHGNLVFDELAGGDASLVQNGDKLREWGWPIPDELLVFGGNGGDELFGLWYPNEAFPDWRTPVVIVGAIFEEERNFALAGTDLAPFLRAWSGHYLQISDDSPVEALDVLDLPQSLRPIDDSKGLVPYFEWADPLLPDLDPNPYERGLTEHELVDLLRSMDLLKPRG